MISMKKLLPLLAVVAAGCGPMSFHTNLDPSNFREYYKPSSVDEVSSADLLRTSYTSLGVVDGLACQIKEGDYIATEADARTDARIKAADMGADVIRFGKCIRLEDTPACKVSVTCYAEAFVEGDKADKAATDAPAAPVAVTELPPAEAAAVNGQTLKAEAVNGEPLKAEAAEAIQP